MPEDRPFLTEASLDGEQTAAAAPPALFDLAVNRAWATLRGLRSADPAAAPLSSSLASSFLASSFLGGWHARTRFARRVPLDAVKAALGQQFVRWLVSPAGQAAIAGYRINGEQLFFPNAGS